MCTFLVIKFFKYKICLFLSFPKSVKAASLPLQTLQLYNTTIIKLIDRKRIGQKFKSSENFFEFEQFLKKDKHRQGSFYRRVTTNWLYKKNICHEIHDFMIYLNTLIATA